ncbi:hypothetical protein HRbin09_00922 [bacterium HR09]|nr:hypothetical protein HRbin09_00922 [bacterium HR09]
MDPALLRSRSKLSTRSKLLTVAAYLLLALCCRQHGTQNLETVSIGEWQARVPGDTECTWVLREENTHYPVQGVEEVLDVSCAWWPVSRSSDFVGFQATLAIVRDHSSLGEYLSVVCAPELSAVPFPPSWADIEGSALNICLERAQQKLWVRAAFAKGPWLLRVRAPATDAELDGPVRLFFRTLSLATGHGSQVEKWTILNRPGGR